MSTFNFLHIEEVHPAGFHYIRAPGVKFAPRRMLTTQGDLSSDLHHLVSVTQRRTDFNQITQIHDCYPIRNYFGDSHLMSNEQESYSEVFGNLLDDIEYVSLEGDIKH